MFVGSFDEVIRTSLDNCGYVNGLHPLKLTFSGSFNIAAHDGRLQKSVEVSKVKK